MYFATGGNGEKDQLFKSKYPATGKANEPRTVAFHKILCTTLLTLDYVNTEHLNSDKPTKSLLTLFQDKCQEDYFMSRYLRLFGFSYPTTVGYQFSLDKKTCLVVQYFAEDGSGIVVELYHGIGHLAFASPLLIKVHLE